MPIGLCSAPLTFQRLKETVLAELTRSCCLVYLDDVMQRWRKVVKLGGAN